MDARFEYVFPSIRGVQSGHEYYVSMCPLRLIPGIFKFDEEELRPELRAQRVLNKARIPEMARYIVANPKDYVFSAITASIDTKVSFEPLAESGDASRIGLLHIPMGAQFIINDGQHRSAAIKAALLENPDLGDETIAVVFFIDFGLERCQQMFSDLNRYAIRPSNSLNVLYDHRDEAALLTKRVIAEYALFRDLVEKEKTSLAPRSRKLFTLSAIHVAIKALAANWDLDDQRQAAQDAISFWKSVADQFPEWREVQQGCITAGEVRRDFIHSHGVVLQSLGRAGNTLLKVHPKAWQGKLPALRTLDWSRANAATWEGRATLGGQVSKSRQNVVLTANVLKRTLDLPLSPEEEKAEIAFLRSEHA